MSQQVEVDLTITNHGSIFLLCPISAWGKEWVRVHIPEDAQWFGGAVAVEHRFIEAIWRGAERDGLNVSA